MENTYIIEVAFGSTGFGFKYGTNYIAEVEAEINQYKNDPTNAIWVWDNKIKDYIYIKKALCYKPEVNEIGAINRDFRFKNRKCN